MRNPALAAWIALAIGGGLAPSIAAAQEFPGANTADAGVRTDGTVDPLAPLPGPDLTVGSVELSSIDAAQLTRWVIQTGDNNDLPFMVIDKVAAEVWAFEADGQFVASTPALVGMKVGDDSVPGVGDRELSQIKPDDRTTPAGRFVAKFGMASGNERVLWVDYPTSISLHPVVTRNKAERRPQRLKSPTPEDNRITFGCINVPPSFYSKVVRPLFKDTTGIVYILPETRPLNEVFLAFQPSQGHASQSAMSNR